MKLVLDTNVLVSPLLNQSGPPGLILPHIAFPDIIICWDKRIMAEYQEVLSRPKFHFTNLKSRFLATKKIIFFIQIFFSNVEFLHVVEKRVYGC